MNTPKKKRVSKLQRYQKALEFYANPKTYQNGGWHGERDAIYYDQGKVAKDALAIEKRGRKR